MKHESTEWIAIYYRFTYNQELLLHSIFKSNLSAVNAVPQELQDILDDRFDFQLNATEYMSSDYWISITKYCQMWLEPRTRKMAELLYG